MNELLTKSATELAESIRKKDVSPLEVVDVHIKRIEEVNDKINAVVVKTFDQARELAKNATEKLAHSAPEDLPPFFGVPCTIKDTYAVKGLPWAGGVVRRRNVIADFDATVVKRIKDAGAIILGKTNIPEAAMWCETYNKVYGRTKNPHDTSRTTGGSSGGEGAIIAAGASPFGPGSDIGGSIRYPAFFNGVIGHKPSSNIVPQTGHWPPAPGETAQYMVCGPLARRVKDCIELLKIFAGPDGIDPNTIDRPLEDPYSVKLKDVKVYYFYDNGLSHAHEDVRLAVRKAVDALEDLGLNVEPWTPPGINRGLEIWFASLGLGGGETFMDLVGGGDKINLWKEWGKMIFGKSDHTFPILGMMTIEALSSGSKEKLRPLYEKGKQLQKIVEEKLGANSVLICQPYNRAAPKHSGPWLSFLAISYSATFNILGLPATVVPIYWNEKGLPVGVQVLGSRFSDHLTLAVGRALEEAYGGWRPASI